MKTKVLTLVMTLVLGAALVYAGNSNDNDPVTSKKDKIEFEVDVNNNWIATVKIVKTPGEQMSVLLKSESGEFLYTKRVKKYGQAEISLDLSNLPEGQYTIQVRKKGKDLFTQKIDKSTDILSVITK